MKTKYTATVGIMRADMNADGKTFVEKNEFDNEQDAIFYACAFANTLMETMEDNDSGFVQVSKDDEGEVYNTVFTKNGFNEEVAEDHGYEVPEVFKVLD